MSDPVTDLAERISGFTFPEDPSLQWSQIALFEEYLRRAALWFEAVPGSPWPFGDFAAAVDPEVRADPGPVQRVEETIPFAQSREVVQTCVNALHFRALQQSQAAIPDLPDPFEPLLLMYERGDGMHSGQIYFEVARSGVKKRPPQHFASNEPRVGLDPETLAEIDRAHAR